MMKTMYHVRLRHGQTMYGMFIEASEKFDDALNEIKTAAENKSIQLHDRYCLDRNEIELVDVRRAEYAK